MKFSFKNYIERKHQQYWRIVETSVLEDQSAQMTNCLMMPNRYATTSSLFVGEENNLSCVLESWKGKGGNGKFESHNAFFNSRDTIFIFKNNFFHP